MTTQLPLIAAAEPTVYPDRESWRRGRQQSIGSSDSATVAGYSRFHSLPSLYGSKVFDLEPDDPDIIQRVGHACEPMLAEEFERQSGQRVADPGDFTIYRSKQHPWLSCTPDRITLDGIPVELKTASFDAAKAWKKNVPIDYKIQNQHTMLVLGAPTSYIAVMLNFQSFKWYEVPRHEGWQRRLVEITGDFWRDYVEPRVMPPMDDSEATRRILSQAYPTHNGDIVEIEQPLGHLGDRWDKLQRIESKANKLRLGIANRIKSEIREGSYARLPDGSGWHWNGRFTRAKEVKDRE